MARLLIFTDLDGTLLDHHSYSFEAASDALAQIRRRAIPLILTSSKTAAEIEALQLELDIKDPFICENGAAVCQSGTNGLRQLKGFARPRQEILEQLHDLRIRRGFDFLGFSDCCVQEIAELTGLSEYQAGLACQREYSEPLLWKDSEDQLGRFLEHLSELGYRAQQGGRFLSVSSPCSKGEALLWLRERYMQQDPVLTVALGDSPNDLDMLARADIAVVIRGAGSAEMDLPAHGQLIRSEQAGPRGWQEVLGALLASDALD